MPFFQQFSRPQDTLRALARPMVQHARTVPAHARHLWHRGRGPLAVFLPYRGREEASLVRIYAIAAALRPLGWRTLVLPWKLTLDQRRRFLALVRADVVVMQGVRHPLNRPALYPGIPIVMDMDDADFHLPHLTAHLRQAMPDLTAMIAGSQYVADWCRDAGCPEAHVVWTGMAASPGAGTPHERRPPVVAWAQTRPMTYTDEARMVREVASALARQRPDMRLRLYDRQPEDDGAFADWFQQAGISVEWCEKSQFSDYLQSFDDVAIGFAPLSEASPFSRGKSFGKVLAYLDRHVPVICSDAGEHSHFFGPDTGIMSNDPDVWVQGALQLLADPDTRQRMADTAFAMFRKELSQASAVSKIDRVLRGVLPEKLHNIDYQHIKSATLS